MGFYKTCDHPLIAWRDKNDHSKGKKSVLSESYKIGKNYAIGEACGRIAKWLDSRKVENRFADLTIEYIEQKFRARAKATKGFVTEQQIAAAFPLIGVYYDYAKGSSLISVLYTAELNGHEVPIHSTADENTPTPEILADRINFLKRENHSPYQAEDAILGLYRKGFDDYGAPHSTLEDFPKLLQDPTRVQQWFVRDEMWTIQQFGEQLKFDHEEMEIEIEGLKIRKYARPGKSRLWFEREIMSLVYAGLDPAFRLEKYGLSAIDEKNPITHLLFETQYKSTTGAYRAIRKNPKRKPLEFDFRPSNSRKVRSVRSGARALSRKLKRSQTELYSLN